MECWSWHHYNLPWLKGTCNERETVCRAHIQVLELQHILLRCCVHIHREIPSEACRFLLDFSECSPAFDHQRYGCREIPGRRVRYFPTLPSGKDHFISWILFPVVFIHFFSWEYFRSNNNAYYAKVGGVSTKEMNELELRFLFSLEFKLQVTAEDFAHYCRYLEKEGDSRRGEFWIERRSSKGEQRNHTPRYETTSCSAM